MHADPKVMATVASVVPDFGVAMLFFRIKRELEMHDEDEAVWIPWADRLLIAATVTSLLGVLVPLVALPAVSVAGDIAAEAMGSDAVSDVNSPPRQEP